MSPLKMLACVAVLLAAASPAVAQRGGGGGQNSLGGSSFGNSLGGNGFGNSFGGGLGGGMNGLGSSGLGGGFGSGMGGLGSGSGSGMGSGFGSSGLGGSGFGQNSFGNNQQGGQNFIGRDSNDMASVFNQLGRNSNQFFRQLNRTLGGGNRNQRNSSQADNAVLPVRVRLDVAFDHPAVQPTVVATAVRGRLETVLARRSIVAPEVEMVGDTVVLRGVAPSESQRLVIEKLVSLEPGVAEVDNQMTVAGEASAGEPSAIERSSNPPLPPQADR